jgi:two-component system, chemotaxis family, response regulator Rcp1
LESSNVFTVPLSIQAPVWAWQSANELSNAQAGEFGWSLNPDRVQRFSLRSHVEKRSDLAASRKAGSILLVEDNPADAGLVREALEEHGVEGELTVLIDGEMAIQFVQDIDSQLLTCPDLIIVDLNLPKKPGREVLECIRRSTICRETPVVILTSSDAHQDKQDAMRLGVSRYLRKPSRLRDFISLGPCLKRFLRAPNRDQRLSSLTAKSPGRDTIGTARCMNPPSAVGANSISCGVHSDLGWVPSMK